MARQVHVPWRVPKGENMFEAKEFLSIVLGLGWLTCSLSAQEEHAQPWRYKTEFFGNVAQGRFYNGSHLWGNGPDYGGGVGVRPISGRLRGFGLELQLAHLNHGELKSTGTSQQLDSRLLMGNVLYHFRSGTRTQPYVFGGVGHVKVEYTHRCVDCVFDEDPITGKLVSRGVSESHTQAGKTGVTLGAGLKIAVQKHLSIRPELLLVDTTGGSGWNWGWVRLQIGMGLHF